MKKVMAGIDLHSNNLVVGIMDQDGNRVGQQKLPCELPAVVKFLAPFKERLEQVAVESTYNWYWLVDGLQASCKPWAIRWCWPILRPWNSIAAKPRRRSKRR